jgi:hypothetical protein
MTEGIKLPPSLRSIVSRYDHYGSPRPEWEIKDDIARRAALKRGKKDKKFARDSHWSVRRTVYEKGINGFLATLVELLGADEARSITRGMRANWEIAASETLRRARARKALTDAAKGRGRPRTPEQRLVAMMVSVEAYMGSGLRFEQALDRASENWGHSFDRFEDIYLKEAKLPHDGGRELLRAFFHKTKKEEVDRFIKDFRGLKTVSE